jgi:hypothetical protein
MHRLFRSLAVLVTAFLLFAGLRVQPTMAQAQDNGLTGANSYESPTYGYTVEWQDPWYALDDQTAVADTGDTLALFSDDFGARVDVYSFATNGRTPQDFAAAYLDFLKENNDNVEVQTDSSDSETAPAYLVSYDLDASNTIDDYFEVQQVDDALILVEVRGAQNMGLILAAAVSVDVTLNGDPLLASFAATDEPTSEPTEEATEEPTEEPTEEANTGNNKSGRTTTKDKQGQASGDLETYESSTFGSTFDYDPDVWTVSDDLTADKNNGRDSIILESEDIPARIYIENYDDYNGKAAACIEAASGEAVGDVDQADLLQDENGDNLEGSSRGKTWVAYAFESDSGDALAAYVECRALPGSAGVFVFTLISTEDAFEDAYNAGLDILDTVSLDGSSADAPVEETPESKSGSDKGNSGNTASTGEYESPTYGYTLAIDTDNWTVTDDSDSTDSLTLEGPNGMAIMVQGAEAGSRDTPQNCVESYSEAYSALFGRELVQATNDGDDIAGEDKFGYYSLYAFEDDNGDTNVLFVECGASPDGSTMVMFTGMGLVDDAQDLIDFVGALITSINF